MHAAALQVGGLVASIIGGCLVYFICKRAALYNKGEQLRLIDSLTFLLGGGRWSIFSAHASFSHLYCVLGSKTVGSSLSLAVLPLLAYHFWQGGMRWR